MNRLGVFFAYAAVSGVFFLILALVAAQGYGWYEYKKARKQPIDYSHEIHVKKNGMKCTQCHTNVDRGRLALVPPMSVCMSCHETVGKDRKEVKKLLEYWKRGEPIPWKRIHKIPRVSMVYFTHKRHVRSFMPRHFAKELEKQGVPENVAKLIAATYAVKATEEPGGRQVEEALNSLGVSSEVSKKVKDNLGAIHTKAVKATCYLCHGKVEYTKAPRKLSPMKMGWCVTCHVKYQAPRDCSTCHQ